MESGDQKCADNEPGVPRRAHVPREGTVIGPHAVAEDVSVLDLELSDKLRDVLRHLVENQRTIDVGSMPVPLLFNRDNPPCLRKAGRTF